MGPALETTFSAPTKARRVDNLTNAENNYDQTDELFKFFATEIIEDVTSYTDEYH